MFVFHRISYRLYGQFKAISVFILFPLLQDKRERQRLNSFIFVHTVKQHSNVFNIKSNLNDDSY